MRRTVVLLHRQPDNTSHFDWLIDQPGINREHRLITFRTPVTPDTPGRFTAQRAPDHRARYLHYQGELSRKRGSVTRVREGFCRDFSINATPEAQILRATIHWGSHTTRVLARNHPDAPDQWDFTITPLNHPLDEENRI